MKTASFDNIKDQIGYCGIWCGSCLVGNGALKELTKRYGKITESYGLKEWAFENRNFEEFTRSLESIYSSSSCSGCLNGGGKSNCEIRNCALDRNTVFCTECREYGKCENSDSIMKMREGARSANLLVKEKNVNRQEFLKKGMNRLKKEFPSCIQLCEEI
jgi:hypothetical protein